MIALTTATKKIKNLLYEPTFYKVIQGGMCFVAGTKVLMADGSYMAIEKLRPGNKVLSRGVDGGIITTEVKKAWYAGDSKPLLSIKVNGNWIKATYDHKFYTTRGYTELYKIAWGKMETSQRVQLRVLCEQYGQDIHLAQEWGEAQPSDNETRGVYRQEKGENKRVLQDNHGSQAYPSPSCGGNDMDTKPRKQATSQSYQWGDYRQQGGKLGMGDSIGKSDTRLCDRAIAKKTGGGQFLLQDDRSKSARAKNAVGHGSGETDAQGICGKVWGIGSDYQGYFREQDLEAFTIDQVQVEEPQKVYSLEINHPSHNYFVSESNINVSNSSSKTFSIMILLIGYAESCPNSLITVAGMTYNHLATGTMRDFKKIMQETGRWDDGRFNKSAKIYTFGNGSQIEFLSTDNMTSRGPRRDVLFVNEANGINYETFDQLAARSRDFVILDYNPSAKFWAHEKLVEKQAERTSFITLTYLDNEALSAQERDNIESRKPKPGEEPSNWWTVYGLGQIGTLEGNIYSSWQELDVDKIATTGKLVRYGLDFGFGHPTAMTAIYENEDGSLGIIEEIYERGILSSQYVDLLKRHNIDPNVLIVADSARPEIISDIKQAGYRIVPANKDAGSVMRGISRVQERQIYFCGKNLKREYLSYAWRKKRSTGETIYEPEKSDDDLMDSLRYAIDDLKKRRIEF